ncbi:MAG: hypothetical protein RSD32_08595 [Oscillospiraceae bacterium]
MELALTLDTLQERVSNKYDYDEKRIVGLMLARYDISLTQNIINDCYQYWHYNTGRTLDIFWAGYGAYLCPSDQTKSKIIMSYPGNNDRAYFDLQAFIGIKNALNDELKRKYKDHIQLVLINFEHGKLHFDNALQIDLEQNIDENYSTIREIVEWITNETRSSHDVVSLVKKLKTKNLLDKIKGISITDTVNIALGVLGLAL